MQAAAIKLTFPSSAVATATLALSHLISAISEMPDSGHCDVTSVLKMSQQPDIIVAVDLGTTFTGGFFSNITPLVLRL